MKHERKGVVTSGGSEGLQWDGADLFKVSAQPEMSYDDAFALIKVRVWYTFTLLCFFTMVVLMYICINVVMFCVLCILHNIIIIMYHIGGT